mmetsp:Transcript_113460/g.301506  ORF Transcript_113460/g.301506 Transcript_113460/m.301506 type:complete len:297 (-) Transcript_113460:99-989(-)
MEPRGRDHDRLPLVPPGARASGVDLVSSRGAVSGAARSIPSACIATFPASGSGPASPRPSALPAAEPLQCPVFRHRPGRAASSARLSASSASDITGASKSDVEPAAELSPEKREDCSAANVLQLLSASADWEDCLMATNPTCASMLRWPCLISRDRRRPSSSKSASPSSSAEKSSGSHAGAAALRQRSSATGPSSQTSASPVRSPMSSFAPTSCASWNVHDKTPAPNKKQAANGHAWAWANVALDEANTFIDPGHGRSVSFSIEALTRTPMEMESATTAASFLASGETTASRHWRA